MTTKANGGFEKVDGTRYAIETYADGMSELLVRRFDHATGNAYYIDMGARQFTGTSEACRLEAMRREEWCRKQVETARANALRNEAR